MARRELHHHVEISDDDRTVVATAEVTSQGPGGTARASLCAESGHITPGRARAWSMPCWTCPKCRKAHT